MALYHGEFAFATVCLVLLCADTARFQAEGESEATLAVWNRLGIVHAVMTSDSDVFLFGGRKVILL
jgi:5'-3' exonuclease